MTEDPDVCRCDKAQYKSRKSAKIAAKKAFPGEHMSAYKCGNGWHIGHLPGVVITGDLDRAELVPNPKRKPRAKRESSPRLDGAPRSNFGAHRAQRRHRPRPDDDYEEDE